jgi:hypothetical protein
MNELHTVDVQEISARAAAALCKVWGRAIRLNEVQPLSTPGRRNFIARALAIDDRGNARPIVVKTTRARDYDPAAEKVIENSGLAREWVATALVSSRAPGRRHGSNLLAGDLVTGTLVFEDLGAGLTSLVDAFLQGTAQAAECALMLYATALGRLHADTIDCLETHHEIYQSIFGFGRARSAPGWRVETDANGVASKLGQAPPASELELLSSRLIDPGPWLTLTHGDPCPDNSLLVDNEIRLIDFEFARPSHALLDGIYWKFGFPTCWCAGRVPVDVGGRIEAAYRAELANSIPLALDDTTYRSELALMSAVWLFTCLSWRLDEALKNDENWGTWSIRGRLLWYLEAVIEMTDAANVLPGINAAARTWLLELRKRWPNATSLGLYPAFASRLQ